jgi:GNAT superfamily N-acetyltransferase
MFERLTVDVERCRSNIRAARNSEAPVLSSLALGSKAHWNYDSAFMHSVAPLLDFTSVDIERAHIYVLEEQEAIVGFYRLRVYEIGPFLDDLWVDPPYIGRGAGKRLWMHALESARSLKWDYFLIEAIRTRRDSICTWVRAASASSNRLQGECCHYFVSTSPGRRCVAESTES